MLEWPAGPEICALGSREVHVWRADLAQDRAIVARLTSTLSVDERQRAEGYRFTQDGERFVVARGILRDILARYVAIRARDLRFHYGEAGKPCLAQDRTSARPHFNVSRSNTLALYAVSRDCELGLDVEYVNPHIPTLEIASHFFSPAAPRRTEAFFNCWTWKEAYVKAIGQGVTISLDSFEVSLLPNQPSLTRAVRHHQSEVSCWSFYRLRPLPGFVAAIAVEGRDHQLKTWQWAGVQGL